MNKLSSEDIAACKALAESMAEATVDSHIKWVCQNGVISTSQVIDLIFDDYCSFSHSATDVLVKNGYIHKPSNSNAHERLLAFKVFEKSYGSKMTSLIKDRLKVYLHVPFREKDAAKSLGAKWDSDKKKWYVPDGIGIDPFSRWIAPPPPSLVETSKLIIDLVPKSAWFSNLRSELTKEEWEKVKKATFKPAQYRCEVCGERGLSHWVECHERWHYDTGRRIQRLVGTIALCPACHEATHYGLTQVRGREKEAKQHIMKVNGWSESQANKYIREKWSEWSLRNATKWILDARWLLDFVPTSDETRNKILDHAAGAKDRTVDDW